MSSELGREVYAEGGNYCMTLGDGVAECRVWRRPDVSREAGAAYAREMVGVFQRVAREPAVRVRGAVMDLREVTVAWGPATDAALGEMFGALEVASRRIAVVSPDNALQMMSLQSLLKAHAPKFGRVFGTPTDAFRWAGSYRQGSG
ncbi:hypothetical protein [Polyangium sp. y55x31]|uniref:hypothetical protein n=1 Tax=Polyangium sp. y55x31 TaxID=3042688 RepID=UPI0024832AFF|nr:hypothetical protein [Polyangium sp. y55x31]MDI1483474.1 hypothetical protein [Polyangium sp. y55x31]